jgi:nitrate/nitrite transport system ATP-binding protein
MSNSDDRFLELSRVSKTFPRSPGNAPVVEGFSLRVARGEFVSLIGHSGCGKSTVLSMIAGLTNPTAGGIILNNREIDGPGTDRGVVFQSPSLLPWMTALENVVLWISQAKKSASRSELRQLARHYLDLVGLGDAAEKRPGELSQGMRQRVGLARAFSLDPQVLLLDEPFGMLDSLTRAELQLVLLELWSRDRKTAVMVTHDVDEALFLSDRVVMMTNGPRARVGEILEIPFERPRCRTELMNDPVYYQYREELVGFLEERAHGEPSEPPAPQPSANGALAGAAHA